MREKERRLTDEQRKLVEGNVGLALTVVLNTDAGKPMDFDDRVGAAYYWLARAAIGFDPSRGWKFSTYATVTIKHGLTRDAHLDRLIHLPVHAFCRLGSGRPAKPPRNPAEAAARAEAEKAAAGRRAAAELAAFVGSLDIPGPSGLPIDPPDREDTTADVLDREALWDRFEAAIAELPPRLKLIIQRRRKGISLVAIGNELRVCKERVRQLEIEAIDLLRAMVGQPESPAPAPKEKRPRPRASWSESLRDWL